MRHDQRTRRTGDNAADITHDIVADARYLFRITHHPDRLARAAHLVRRHGVKLLFRARGRGHADHVEHDAEADKEEQHHKRQDCACAVKRFIRDIRHDHRQHKADRHDRHDPADVDNGRLLRRLFLLLVFC